MNKLIMGRYLPGDSLIYQLDPRGKFLLTFYFVGIVFLANNVASYVFLMAFVLFAVYLSKINFGFFIKGLRPIFWLILFTVLLQLFFTPSSHPIPIKQVQTKNYSFHNESVPVLNSSSIYAL